MIVKMITHSNTIHLAIQMAARLNGFCPDKMYRLEGRLFLSASDSCFFFCTMPAAVAAAAVRQLAAQF